MISYISIFYVFILFRFAVNNFQNEVNKTQLDLTADSEETLKMQQKLMRWDRKKKKMVGVEDPKFGKIRTESGAWIPATYKSNRYAQWKDKTKTGDDEGDDDDDDDKPNKQKVRGQTNNTHWGRHNLKVEQKGRSELKQPTQILKTRMVAEKKKMKNKKKSKGKKKAGNKSRRK